MRVIGLLVCSLCLVGCDEGGGAADGGMDAPNDDASVDGGGEVWGDIDTSAFDGLAVYVGTEASPATGFVRDLATNTLLAEIAPPAGTDEFLNPGGEGFFLSADGSTLVYTRLTSDPTFAGFLAGEIVVRDLATGDEQSIPQTVEGRPDAVRYGYRPKVSADGSVVVFFESVREGEGSEATDAQGIGVWDGSTVRTLVEDENPDAMRLTADGTTLFYVRDTDQVRRVDVASGSDEEVGFAEPENPECRSLSLDQDGDWDMSDDGSVHAFMCALEGEDTNRLFIMKDGVITRVGDLDRLLNPTVSGDGSTVAVTHTGEGELFNTTVYIVDTDSFETTEFTLDSPALFIELNQDGSIVGWYSRTPDFLLGALTIARRDGSEATVLAYADEDAYTGVGELQLR